MLYVILIPSKYSEEKLFEEMTRHIIRPAIAERKQQLQDMVRNNRGGLLIELCSEPQISQPSLSQLSCQKKSLPTVIPRSDVDVDAACDRLKRAVLAYDGAHPQVNHKTYDTFMPGHIADKNEVFKWPAGASMLYQWGDAAHVHKEFKDGMRKVFNTPIEEELKKKRFISPQIMEFVTGVLPKVGLSAGSLKTYSRFFLHIDDVTSRVFHRDAINEGARLSGAQGGGLMDLRQIYSRCSIWLDLQEEQRVAILERSQEGAINLDTLALSGYLPDECIDEAFADIIDLDPDTAKDDNVAMNHHRCLWLTCPGFMEQRLAEQTLALEAQEDSKRKAELKLAAKTKKEAAEAVKEAERKRRLAGQDPAAAGPAPKKLRLVTVSCSNTNCPNTAIKDSPQHENWSACTAKGCKVVFCASCSSFHLTPHFDAVHK